MIKLSPSQAKILADFCSDVAKGALLSGLGFSFVLPEPPILRIMFFLNALIIAAFTLYLALEIAKIIEK